ncbi:hypothetical protein QBC38DRAFT_419266 [Podospora fimiseda]|uniref:UBC core domain-containing protein n=1 Tax=Podospora fimiseda TaxID=252190 RepID=A0AAN7BN93_9PEZI|nr:hypothetical protein QBC38DRAFT_419266 [Podospora fimiseda]
MGHNRMPQLRQKLGKGIQKVHGMFKNSKRRISEDSLAGSSQQSKQLRTTQEQVSIMFAPLALGVSYLSAHNPAGPANVPTDPGMSLHNPIDLTSLDSDGDSSVQEIPNPAYTIEASLSSHQATPLEQHQDPPMATGFLALGGHTELASWKKRLQSRKCGKCSSKGPLLPSEKSIVPNTKKMLDKGFLHPFVQCQNCKTWNCIECDVRCLPSGPHLQQNTVSVTKTLKMTWCCDGGRIFILHSLLCGLDIAPKPSTLPVKKPDFISDTSAAISKTLPQKPATTSAFSKGTGYGGSHGYFLASIVPPRSKKPKVEQVEAEAYFHALGAALPCMSRDKVTAFDNTPHPLVSALLPRSPILRLASEILRTAAMEEINVRHSVINAVLVFLEGLSNHYHTTPVMFQEQIFYPPSQQLLAYTLQPSASTGPYTRSRSAQPKDNAVPETGQSLFQVIEEAAVTARVFVESASKRPDALETNEENNRLLATAKRISSLADFLRGQQSVVSTTGVKQATAPVVNGPNVMTRSRSVKGKKAAPAPDEMEKWHRQNCAKGVPEGGILHQYAFAAEAAKIGNQGTAMAANRMKKLFTQISSLHAPNALTNGIYVRYGEDRPDIIKALIIGPTNTPYQNGVFEFDMLCGANFPQQPPQVSFRTTGGGRFRFNPNLYDNGTVCLSLLGTWNGHPWDPAVSTISQVLLSIQSMIFVENPYYNEPGYENRPMQSASDQYNRRIEPATIQHAMMPWLPPNEVNPLWADVIQKHFEVNGHEIAMNTRKWMGVANTGVTMDILKNLEKGLEGYGGTTEAKVSSG